MTLKTANILIAITVAQMIPVTIWILSDPPHPIIYFVLVVAWTQIIGIGWLFRSAAKPLPKPDYRKARGVLAPLFADDPRPSEQIVRDYRDGLTNADVLDENIGTE